MSERHLGLIPSLESGEAETLVERIGRKMASYLDLDSILAIARELSPPHPPLLPPGERETREIPVSHDKRETKEVSVFAGNREALRSSERKTKIGVIRDRVFNFYYPENLEALTRTNAELIFINSLQDRLPKVDGLYIGGGFPEFFLEALERNRELRHDIAEAIEEDLPVYAECAGLMYLCRGIRWQDRSYEMVGAIPADVELSQRPEGHGYVVAKVIEENRFFPVGLTIRGHEFHHSKVFHLNGSRFAYQIMRGHGINGKEDGILYKNLFASYIHLHALGTPEWAEGFVALVHKGKNKT
jgi:cobyrinic acid a,c-diamide synthase